jgi:soluble lytic murein transglycosylase
MTLLRTLTGTSLFALVLSSAIAAPISRPATLAPPPPPVGMARSAVGTAELPVGTAELPVGTAELPVGTAELPVLAPPPVVQVKEAALAMADIDVTGSLGTPSRRVANAELATLNGVINAYQNADLSGGDLAGRALADPAARALAEWVAIRTAPRSVGYGRIVRFLETYPNWPSNPALRRLAEEALYLDGVETSTVRAFFAGRKPLTDEGKVALARARLESGDRAGASALIRDAYRNDPLASALETTIVKSYGSLLSRADHKFRADRLVYDGDHNDALRAAARAGADVVAVAKARIAFEKKARNAAALLASVPASSANDPAFLFAKVKHLRRSEKIAEAAAILARAPRDATALVRPDEWWTERRLVARELLDRGDAKTAYNLAAGFTAETDTTAMEAEFHAGWIALRFLGDGKLAARHFANLRARAERPISVARGAYWQGRAAEMLGDRAGAERRYQEAASHSTTYYGQIARARLGLPGVALRKLPAPASGVKATFNGLLATRAIEMLYALNEKDLARGLVIDMANSLQDSEKLALLGDLAMREKDTRAALSVGKSATQRGFPLESIAFPTAGIPSFRALSDVEKAVVFGIARQESEFRHDAVSGAGARGIMQVMPATAKATARQAGLPYDAKRLTTDPAYNAQIGSAHLGELIGNFRGSYIMTFAAYNAGSSRVADWVQTYGDPRDPAVDPIDWVERIPFTETRNYVQRVMENVQVYRARLGQNALLIETDLRRGAVR